jgi:membrane-bound lytic murein transglycosylase D
MAIFRKVILFSVALVFLFSCTSVPLNATSSASHQKAPAVKNTKPVQEIYAASTPEEPRRLHPVVSKTDADPNLPGSDIKSSTKHPKKENSANQKNDEFAENGNQANLEDLQDQQETLDQALELLNQSQSFWQQGDIDNSLRCLDEAYALILEVNGEPEIARQKDDLRLIISKRIMEISTSKRRVTTGKQSEIPLIMNADVEREIRSFQTVERSFFIRSYQRSGQFRPIIVKYLQEAGLPKELSWLPLVESGFQCNALSRARALGLWQFIPSTGYKFSLQRDRWIDERLDVEKSTKAAIAYLKELHDIFGDWLTCLAAYNCGEGRVLRVISKQHINYLDHFWDLYRQLPNETARYVPRFLATIHIIKDPKKYGIDLDEDLDKPIPYEAVKVDKCMRIQDIAQHLNVSKEVMAALNSELKLQLTPDKPYNLKVPGGMGKLVLEGIDNIPKWEPPRAVIASRGSGPMLVRHKVKKGDSLNGIARRYKTTVRNIMKYNDLSSKKIIIGKILRVPARGYTKKAATAGKKKIKSKALKVKKQSKESARQKIIRYKVKKGDTIASIAKHHGVTIREIRNLNNIRGSKLKADQVIKIKDKS